MTGDRDLLLIVAALTARLGGEVHLTWEELVAVPRVDIYRQQDPAGDVLLRLHQQAPPEVLHADVVQVGDPVRQLPA